MFLYSSFLSTLTNKIMKFSLTHTHALSLTHKHTRTLSHTHKHTYTHSIPCFWCQNVLAYVWMNSSADTRGRDVCFHHCLYCFLRSFVCVPLNTHIHTYTHKKKSHTQFCTLLKTFFHFLHKMAACYSSQVKMAHFYICHLYFILFILLSNKSALVRFSQNWNKRFAILQLCRLSNYIVKVLMFVQETSYRCQHHIHSGDVNTSESMLLSSKAKRKDVQGVHNFQQALVKEKKSPNYKTWQCGGSTSIYSF